MTSPEHKRILAVIPCYNEELSFGNVVSKTKLYVDEVVVVNDGSRDNTSQIAQEAGANVLVHKKKQRKKRCDTNRFSICLSEQL